MRTTGTKVLQLLRGDRRMRDDDISIFAKQNYGRRMGIGASPALLIVDLVNGFRDPALFGSAEISQAIVQTRELLSVGRVAKVPVVYTRVVFSADGSDRGLFALKVPGLDVLTENHPSSQVVSELAPRDSEIVIRKRYPSAFFATDLASLLRVRGVDTVIIAGCTTSGCVQATVVDAMGYGFRPVVVRECVDDRHRQSHEMALLNIDMKYGDVISLNEVLAWLNSLRQGAPCA